MADRADAFLASLHPMAAAAAQSADSGAGAGNGDGQDSAREADAESIGPFVANPLSFSKTLLPMVRQCVQAANQLPSDPDFAPLAALLPRGKLEAVRARLCSTIESLAAAYETQIGADQQSLADVTDADDAMERVVEMTDHIIEGVDDCVDQIKRINRYAGTQANYTYRDPHARKRPARRSSGGGSALASDTVLEKPQKYFEDKIDNSHAPFVPKYAGAVLTGYHSDARTDRQSRSPGSTNPNASPQKAALVAQHLADNHGVDVATIHSQVPGSVAGGAAAVAPHPFAVAIDEVVAGTAAAAEADLRVDSESSGGTTSAATYAAQRLMLDIKAGDEQAPKDLESVP
eukprot:SAG31_NODE_11070_length_1069_cov_1.585567_1_plen_345_part_10